MRLIAALILLSLCAFPLMAQTADAASDAARKLHALFEEDWQWGLKEFPEGATFLGDNRYNDRLTDLSPAANERRDAHDREMLARIQTFDRSRLSGEDLLSYDLFLRDKQLAVEGQKFHAEWMPISQMNGVQIIFGQLVGATPFHNARDYENYLTRLNAFPLYIDQTIALMKRGIESGWTWPAVPLRSVPAQLEGQIADDPAQSPAFQPFKNFPADVPPDDRARLTAAGQKAISQSVTPALKKLDAFFKGAYLPAARKEIGASSLPDGEAFYNYMVRVNTTTNMTPKEIHELGLREIARIRREMEQIIRQVGFKGTFQEFLTFLRTDPRFYFTNSEDLVRSYRDICKRTDAKLPELFAELPRNSYGVKEIPAYEAPAQTTAYYFPGAADGSRAGTYWVNTYKLNTRPKYEMEVLSLHESVPGHHLQIARAQELKGLPDFRRNGGYTAFVEGWGLYSESLGSELGFYTDPYSKFGQLTYEMWRACRLVVDTGMHSFHWTREQAINLMKENTAKTENDIIVEVDRYLVMPGQALAYKIGELKIKELRARAREQLQDQFDLRKFHNAVLDEGALPLETLEQRINLWIADQQKKGGQKVVAR